MTTIVVLPTYNEIYNIGLMVDGLTKLDTVSGPVDVLVVDDSSPDGTGQHVKDLAARHSPGRVNLMSRPQPEGLGAAYRAGFAWALDHGYEIIVQMDADGSHPVPTVAILVEALAAGAELAIGSRYIAGGSTDPNWAWHRKVLSAAGNVYSRAILRVPYRDLTGGFKAWRADLLRSIMPIGGTLSGYAFQIHTTYAAHLQGAVIAETPFQFKERVHGASKMNFRIVTEGITSVLTMGLRPPAIKRTGASKCDVTDCQQLANHNPQGLL